MNFLYSQLDQSMDYLNLSMNFLVVVDKTAIIKTFASFTESKMKMPIISFDLSHLPYL